MPGFWGWKSWRKGWGWQRRGWGWSTTPALMQQMNLPPEAIPLERVPSGTKVKVVAIVAGMGATNRALQMGIAPGSIIEVIDNNLMYPWTPILIKVNNMTVALGRGLASRIMVVPIIENKDQTQEIVDKSGIREA